MSVPVKKPRLSVLSALIVCAALAGLFLSLQQADELSVAQRSLPPGCVEALARLPRATARTNGVALRGCAEASLSPQYSVTPLGTWAYGPSDAPQSGELAWLREDLADGTQRDRIMHIRIFEGRALLQSFEVEGVSCAGGVQSANLEGDSFGLVLHLTPRAIVGFVGGKQDVRLADDPHWCAGEIVVVDRRPVVLHLFARPQTETGQRFAQSSPGMLSEHQRCFDGLVADFAAKGQETLSYPDGYSQFSSAYAARCLQDKGDKK